MNVEIGTEAAEFPEKEYINGIFLAVYIYKSSGCRKSGIVRSEQSWILQIRMQNVRFKYYVI